MTEHLGVDYVSGRQQVFKELFGDSRLAETGIPFDRQSLAEGIGSVGLTGYYLQHGARHSTPPAGLRPILQDADQLVQTTLERHNKAAKDPTTSHTAAFAILDETRMEAVSAITSTVMQRWTRVLWTKDGTLLLPDRRLYARRGQSEEDNERERYAKLAIIEIAAAALQIMPLLTSRASRTSAWQQRRATEIIVGRGPEFMQQWMSRSILRTWLDANVAANEQEDWNAFADRTTLLRALIEDIADPLTQLQRLKKNHDAMSDKAIAVRVGWSQQKVRKEFPAGVRKKLAAMHDDPLENIRRVAARLDECSEATISKYTGWPKVLIREVFSQTVRRSIAIERSAPIEESVIAIVRAYNFLNDTEALAACIGWERELAIARFTPVVRQSLALKIRPSSTSKSGVPTEKNGSSDEVDDLQAIKSLARVTAERFDFLYDATRLAAAIGWTPEDTAQFITVRMINFLALKGSDHSFSSSLEKLRNNLPKVSDRQLAIQLGVDEETVRQHMPWSLRQYCLIDFAGNPLQALHQWWLGEKKIVGWRHVNRSDD